MPSLDGKRSGIDACAEIKKLDPKVIVVMATALGHKKSVIDSIKAGASAYIVKPIDEENLKKVYAKVLKNDFTW